MFLIPLTGAFAQQAPLLQDVKLEVVYHEVRENTFKTEDLSQLKDYQKINLLSKKNSLQITQLESHDGNAQVRIEYLDREDGVWPKERKEYVFDPNVAPGNVSNVSGPMSTSILNNSTQKTEGNKMITSTFQPDFIQKNQFPVLTKDHFTQLENAKVPFSTLKGGTTIIHFTPNYTLEINPTLKTVEEIIRLNTQGNSKTVVKNTKYTKVNCPYYVNQEGDPIHNDSNPLWFPTEITITQDDALTGGACIQKRMRITREVKSIEGVADNPNS